MKKNNIDLLCENIISFITENFPSFKILKHSIDNKEYVISDDVYTIFFKDLIVYIYIENNNINIRCSFNYNLQPDTSAIIALKLNTYIIDYYDNLNLENVFTFDIVESYYMDDNDLLFGKDAKVSYFRSISDEAISIHETFRAFDLLPIEHCIQA